MKLKIQTGLRRHFKEKKKNFPPNPNKIQIIYLHMKVTNMKMYEKLNINKHENEKCMHDNI